MSSRSLSSSTNCIIGTSTANHPPVMASSFTSGVDVSWKAALASQKDADSPRLLLASELRSVLANPEQYGLAMGVWFMLDADESLVAAHAPHTRSQGGWDSVPLLSRRWLRRSACTDRRTS